MGLVKVSVFAASLIIISVPCSAQEKPSSSSDMEKTLSSYWSNVGSHAKNDAEKDIFNNHKSVISSYDPSETKIARSIIYERSGLVTKKYNEYHRITCSASLCEMILVYPDIPGTGPVADNIVKEFYSNITKSKSFLKLVGPSVITEGPTSGTGLSILAYANVEQSN